MKIPELLLIALALLTVAHAQQPPDAPSPANPLSDAEWQRIEQIVNGQEISVHVRNAFPLDCRFAEATDAELFCDCIDAPPGESGYRIARANVLSVRVVRPRRDLRPGLVAAMVVGGGLIGIGVARNGTASQGAAFGGFAALMVGGIGYLMSEGNHPGANGGMLNGPPAVGIGLRLPIHPHSHFPLPHPRFH